MRDATHTLMCSLLPDLPSSLSSSLSLAEACSSRRQSTQAVHQGMSLSPPSLPAHSLPLVSSVSGSLTYTLPHLLLSYCLLLTHSPVLFGTLHALQKTTIKQTCLLVSLRSGTPRWLYAIYTKYKLFCSLQHP